MTANVKKILRHLSNIVATTLAVAIVLGLFAVAVTQADEPTPTRENLAVTPTAALPSPTTPAADEPALQPSPTPPAQTQEPSWSIALSLALGVVVVLQTFLLSRQVPADKIIEIVGVLEPLVARTPNTLDDRLLELLKTLIKAQKSEDDDDLKWRQ